jgi:hypothetical protein
MNATIKLSGIMLPSMRVTLAVPGRYLGEIASVGFNYAHNYEYNENSIMMALVFVILNTLAWSRLKTGHTTIEATEEAILRAAELYCAFNGSYKYNFVPRALGRLEALNISSVALFTNPDNEYVIRARDVCGGEHILLRDTLNKLAYAMCDDDNSFGLESMKIEV